MLSPSKVDQEARLHLRHNVIVNILDGAFFGFALGFGSFGTMIPLFVSRLTDSALLIGLIPAIHNVGWQLPQLFTAGYVARLRRYKPFVLMMTFNERIPFLGLALVAWYLTQLGVSTALAITFIMLVWQGFGGGFAANAWTTFIAKIIPSDSRGTFFGAQAAAANIMLSMGAISAGYLLDTLDDRLDFTVCFALTVILMAISFAMISMTREPEDTEKIVAENPLSFWHDARDILRRDLNFRWFIFSRFMLTLATMGFSFFVVYGLRRFHMSDVTAGFLTATLTISGTLANLVMGWLGDRIGHRKMMVIGAIAAALSLITAWAATSINWFYLIFILAAVTNVAYWTIGLAIIVQFGSEAERPVYIGLSNTLIAPITILAPLFGGWLADRYNFETTFIVSAALSILTALLLMFIVKDPTPGNVKA
jgi:MFS family permease